MAGPYRSAHCVMSTVPNRMVCDRNASEGGMDYPEADVHVDGGEDDDYRDLKRERQTAEVGVANDEAMVEDIVIIKGNENKKEDHGKDRIAVSNVSGFVSCATFVTTPKKLLVCLGLCDRCEPQPMFKFSSGRGVIKIYDMGSGESDNIELNFGYVRKMSVEFCENSFDFVALFNDGRIRTFRYKKKRIFDINALPVAGTVCYCSDGLGRVFSTDGFKIVDIKDGCIVNSIESSNPVIIAMSLFISDRNMAMDNDEKSPRSDSYKSWLFYLNAEGHVFRTDLSFTETLCVFKLIGTTDVIAVGKSSWMLLVDSFEHITKYVSVDSVSKSHAIFKEGITCACGDEAVLVAGGFDGSIMVSSLSKSRPKSSLLFRCQLRGKTLYMYTSEGNSVKSFNYPTAVVGVSIHKDCVYAVYRCGVIVEYVYHE